MEPVSRFKRFLAHCIDWLICVIVVMVLTTVYIFVFPINVNAIFDNLDRMTVGIITYLIMALYYAFFESSKHRATPGKIVFRMCVSTKTGDKLTFLWSLYRYFIWMFPGILQHSVKDLDIYSLYKNIAITIQVILGLVWLLPIYFTKNRLCLHDIITETRVVKKVIKK